MPIHERIASLSAVMTEWRQHLHAHPETAFEEHRTADFVADRLAEFGIGVHRGLASTGVVGSVSTGPGPTIALRADMDALPIAEHGEAPYRSRHAGKMHACGHDGHMAMLLGAARYLAETRRFRGTVHFIFQPAEENAGGARVMVEEGLFRAFPADRVYGMHNFPGLPAGVIAVRAGPIMAACDVFRITVRGRGTHAAMPQFGTDCVVAAAAIVIAVQTIVSRSLDPVDAAVISVTQIQAGDTSNVIPDHAILIGTSRSFRPEVQDEIERRLAHIVASVAAAHGCSAELHYDRHYPPTINEADATERAARAAAEVVGEENVLRQVPPTMGAEDFSFMLRERPGCYVWIGGGRGDDCSLHNPGYDFNDAILAIGASYWAALIERELA